MLKKQICCEGSAQVKAMDSQEIVSPLCVYEPLDDTIIGCLVGVDSLTQMGVIRAFRNGALEKEMNMKLLL